MENDQSTLINDALQGPYYREDFPRKECVITANTLKDVIQRMEDLMFCETLEASGGNRSQTARNLGLPQQGMLNNTADYQLQVE